MAKTKISQLHLIRASFAGDLQTISWLAMALGGICGSLLGGFALTNLQTTTFINSKLSNASIQEALLKKVQFQYSNLIGIQLYKTNLSGIDFSTCDITGIVVLPQDLRGIIVDEYQAMELSKLLGIVVK